MSRQTIHVAGFAHVNPIPAAARIGAFIATGLIYGRDPETGRPVEGLDAQCRMMFQHLRTILAAAGAGPEHILKLNVFLADLSDRAALNREWVAMFPDANDMPVRQTMQADASGGALIQCDCLAVVPV